MSSVHRTLAELNAGLAHIEDSPKDGGALRLIVRRPRIAAREVVAEAELDVTVGLVGDTWSTRRGWRRTRRAPDPNAQVTIMNARATALVAHTDDRWPLVGDQLYVDLDLSEENLPAGAQVMIGTAVIEVTGEPHIGCRKFSDRFGVTATKFVNSKVGKRLSLRGIKAKVVQSGRIRVGDFARKRA